MRKLLLRVVVGLIAFGLGVVGASVVGNLVRAPDDSVFIVKPVTKAEIGLSRFSFTGHACGDGYVDGYRSDDGRRLDEGVAVGSPKEIKQRIRKLVRDAKQVVERVPKYRNDQGEVGERIVIVAKADEFGREWASIIFYDGGDHYRYIDAPTLELALEFEEYLIIVELKSLA